MFKTLKSLALAGTLLLSTIPILSVNLTANAADGDVFASGQNSFNGSPSTSTHQDNWGAALDLTGLPSASLTNVIGAKVTVYSIGGSRADEIAACATVDEKKQLMREWFQNPSTGAVQWITKKGPGYTSFVVYNDATYANYVTYCNPYYAGPNGIGRENGDKWVHFNDDGSVMFGGETLNNLRLSSPALAISDALYNSTVWQITSNNFYFEGHDGTLPNAVKSEIADLTLELMETSSSGVNQGDYVVWFIEPLINLEVKGTTGQWYQGAAATPTMAAWLYDNCDSTGIKSWISDYVNLTGTDGLAGSTLGYTQTGLVGQLNTSGLGAYAVVVEPEDLITRDELPEVPSVPVFQKNGSNISYLGVSSSVTDEAWNDITEVLNYAMNLSDAVPTSALYNYCSSYVSSMKAYADNVYDSAGNYAYGYKNAYTALWGSITRYYNGTSISLGADSATLPAREATNQPTSCSYKFTSGGPFSVDTSLAGVSASDLSLVYEDASVYKLSTATGIVSTAATSTSSLGAKQGDAATSISLGNILRNPYAYSIVVEATDVVTGDAYPEMPNIVVWDEESGQKWNATIDASTWNKFINTLKYMRNDNQSTNPTSGTTSTYAEKARAAAVYLQGTSVNTYNTWQTQLSMAQAYQTKLNNLESYLKNTVIPELNTLLNNSHQSKIIFNNHSLIQVVEYERYSTSSISFSWQYRADWGKSIYELAQASQFARVGLFNTYTSYNFLSDWNDNSAKNWKTIFQNYMNSNYYNRYFNAAYQTCIRYTSTNTCYATGSQNGWQNDFFSLNYIGYPGVPSYSYPVVKGPASGNSVYGDVMAILFVQSQVESYNAMIDNEIAAAKAAVAADITDLQTKINRYNSMVKQFKENYNAGLDALSDSTFNSVKIVSGTKTGLAVTNNVETILSLRSTSKLTGLTSAQYKFPAVCINTSVSPNQAYNGTVSANNYYSAYYSNGNKYTLAGPSGSLKGTLDGIYNSRENNLNFKYRVVQTADASTVMTFDNIENYATASCGYQLTVSQVLNKPYSYGIIMNSYEITTSSTDIKEWQLSRHMQVTGIPDDSIWAWDPIQSHMVKTFTFDPPSSSFLIGTSHHSPHTIHWYTGKVTGSTAPGLTSGGYGSALTSLTATGLTGLTTTRSPWNTGNYSETAIYKLTHNWLSNQGTIDILTATISATISFRPTHNTETVDKSPSTFNYSHNNTGSTFDIWRDGSTFEMYTEFPMMIASQNADYIQTPLPVKAGTNVAYTLNGSKTSPVYGYYPVMCQSDISHSITTPYNVKVTYQSNSKIRTTFSTDKEDTTDMGTYVDNGTVVPYLKAGQTFEGEITNNKLILEGYCNVVQTNTDKYNRFVKSATGNYPTQAEFKQYMDGIAAQLANCDIEVLSTINGFNVKSDNTALSSAADFEIEHTYAGGNVDNDAGIVFEDNATATTYNVSAPSLITYQSSKFRTLDTAYSQGTDTLFRRTQIALDSVLIERAGVSNWYCEMSEPIVRMYYKIEIPYQDCKFTATISRYESDGESDPNEYLNNQVNGIANSWRSSFGYSTYLGKTNNTYTNVIVSAIDISGLTGDARELFKQDSGEDILAILGKQTPINIRGSVYDNT